MPVCDCLTGYNKDDKIPHDKTQLSQYKMHDDKKYSVRPHKSHQKTTAKSEISRKSTKNTPNQTVSKDP